jgi:tRNA/tmRNA/rRNA uracil-C5-methylase (TrmA/RlmC/RlmD family)
MARHARQRAPKGRSRVGERFTVDVGPVAHGGHFVARIPGENRVVFVRHALPGEQTVVEITEGTEGDRFWRGDAVEVLSESPDRVAAPCPYAGPGLCGGCDFQHVALPAQRDLKTSVVREQLVRLGGLAADDPLVAGLEVEDAGGRGDGLHWRTRAEFALTRDGRLGMRRHRSHDVIPVDDCLIAVEDAARRPTHGAVVESVETARGTRSFTLDADSFWQVHPNAPRLLVETVLDFLDPQSGERALDLYAGVGLFAGFLGEAVGPTGRVTAVEGSKVACDHARRNLADLQGVRISDGSVDRVLATAYDEPFDLVVLDPPREGARRKVVTQVVDRAPRAVAYVACDPAALARDVKTFSELGYRFTRIRAFDLFPMTHHIESVALLVPA